MVNTLLMVKGTLSGLRQFLVTESPLKMMKNAFYFILKAIFVLKIFKCLSWLSAHAEKRLDWKIRLISKFLASQPGKQAISIHILPSISKSKGNQTMKFGQLVEHHMRNILLEKSLKNQNYIWVYLDISGSTFWILIQWVLLHLQVDKYLNIW